jgi:hypothetical protein
MPAYIWLKSARSTASHTSHARRLGEDSTSGFRLTSAWNHGPLQAHLSLDKTPACDAAQAHR